MSRDRKRAVTGWQQPARHFRHSLSFALVSLLAMPAYAQGLADPVVRRGDAGVTGLGTGSVVVTQRSDKAVIDWRRFSVDAGTSITFDQRSSSSIALNRVTGTDASTIDGTLSANGQVWLVNPNGVLIGRSGQIQAGGWLATTAGIADDDFMAGRYRFAQAEGGGSVANAGSVVVAEGGYAVLAGRQVTNDGLIRADLGEVALGAGSGFAVDLVGDRLLSFEVTGPLAVAAPLVDNRGTLSAAGGKVLMTARAASDLVGRVVNTTGVIDASGARYDGGEIVLDGGTGEVFASGTLNVSATGAGKGGTIALSGDTVLVGEGALLNARGAADGGSILVGGGWQGAQVGGRPSAVRTAIGSGAVLDASATGQGNGGTVVVWSDVTNARSQTIARGTLLALGGAQGGDGGRIETSGHYLDTVGATGSAAAPFGAAGKWLFDPYDVEVVASVAGAPNGGFSGGTWSATGSPSQIAASQINALLNSGTSVYITTDAGGAGSDAGNITVNASILKTAGGNAALVMGADNGIYINQSIRSQQGGLTLNLTAGAGGIHFDGAIDTRTGTMLVETPGAVTQSASIATRALYVLQGDDVSLSDPGNVIGQISGTADSLTFSTQGPLSFSFTAANGVDIHATGDIDLAGDLIVGGESQVVADGRFRILPYSTIAASADIALAGESFVNLADPSQIATSNGARWLIFSDTPDDDVFGGLQSGNLATWGTEYQGMASWPTGPGNHYIFAVSPVLEFAVSNDSKTYGDTASTAGRSYSYSGLVDAAAYGDVFLQDSVSGVADVISAGDDAQANAGTYALGPDLAALTLPTGYTFTTTGTLTVDPRALTLSAITDTRVYDGTTASALAGTAIGLVNGDTVTGLTQSFDARDAGTRDLVLDGGYVINDGNGGANYVVTEQDATGTITPRALTASLIGSVSKTYDGIDTATLASGNYQLTGVVAGDAVTLSGATAGTYDNRNAGTGKLVSVTGLTLGGTDAGNYTVNAGASGAIGRIDPRALTASLTGSISKIYDGTDAATLAAGNYQLTGAIAGDAVTLNAVLSGTYDNRNAGTGKLVSVTGLTLGGTDAGNYTVNAGASGAIGRIDPRALTASLTGSISKIYDGTDAATLGAGNYQLTGAIAGDAVTLNAVLSGTYDNRNAGTGKLVSVTGLTLGGTDAGNYTVNAGASGAIGRIDPRALTASLAGSISKIYDGTDAATLASGNYQLTGAIAGDAVTLNAVLSGTYDNRNAGTGKLVSVTGLTLGDTDAGNYTVNAGASGAIGRIDPRALTASLIGSASKTYDGTTAATLTSGNYQLSGAIAGDAVRLNAVLTGIYDNRNAGTGKLVSVTGLTLGGTDAANYTVNAGASAAIGRIDPRALTASLIGSTSKTYDGTATAALTLGNYQLSGAIAGDTVTLNAVLSGTYDNRNAGTGKLISVAGLTLGGTDAANYTVNASASGAIGRIDPRALTASLIGSTSKTYDGTSTATLTAGNYQLTGAIAGDAVTLNAVLTGLYDNKNAGTGKSVSAAGLTLGGADAANYTVNAGASGAIGRIDPRALTVALVGTVVQPANGSTAARLTPENFALAGFVAGEGARVTQNEGSYASANAGTGIIVTTTLGSGHFLADSGTSLGNYVLPLGSLSGAIGTINPALQPVVTLSVTPTAPDAPASDASAPTPAPSSSASEPVPAASATPLPTTETTPASSDSASATPEDAADAEDPILAAVGDEPSESPPGTAAPGARVTPILGKMLGSERRGAGSAAPGVEHEYSGSGAPF